MKSINEKFWNKYFESYDVLKNISPYNDLIEEVTKLMKNRRVLDIGSGTGNFVLYMNNNGIKTFGIDSSDIGISISKQKGLKEKVFKKNVILDNLPFGNNYFDGVIMINTFYFIDPNKRDMVMKKILDTVKNNSRLIIVDMKNKYKPFAIYKAHIKESLSKKGATKTLFELIKLISPTIKMFFHNMTIKKNCEENENYFFSKEKYVEFLNKYGYNVIEFKNTLAGQGVLIVADRIT